VDKAFEDEIVAQEHAFWRAMQDKDAAAAEAMSAERFVLTDAQGASRIEASAFGRMMAGASWTLDDYAIRDPKVEKVTDDVAVIGYMVHETLTVNGKPVEFDAADASTWVRRDGRWVCILHTESIAGDPYGRDRRPAS
jgi:hypothetical protein